MTRYACSVCGYVYDPVTGDPDRDLGPMTRFEDLPNTWTCPICLASKHMFREEASYRQQQNQVTAAAMAGISSMDEWLRHDLDEPADSLYRDRFENLVRVAKKITSSLSIGNILEMIRDEAKTTIPRAQEACLLIFDGEALHYTRPLHCAVYKDRINCQLCKRGRATIEGAVNQPLSFQCSFREKDEGSLPCESGRSICEIALPIFDGEKPLGVLDIIAKEGQNLDQRDIILLRDLADLATNTIINARSHWRMSQEKLTMDHILAHLRPFVPQTVHQIVEKDPFDPHLDKRDLDVSILFLDVAGYTRISQTLTQDKVNFIIEKYFSSFLDVIYEWGGDINETAGDGLMIIFHGDPRENAIHASKAALDIRRRTTEINKELEGRFEPVSVNMGINSGLASVGMTRFHGAAGTRMTFTASGPTTNLAARIAAAATQGDILLGAETAWRIHGEIPHYPRGGMLFKNIEDAVQVYSLVRQE